MGSSQTCSTRRIRPGPLNSVEYNSGFNELRFELLLYMWRIYSTLSRVDSSTVPGISHRAVRGGAGRSLAGADPKGPAR